MHEKLIQLAKQQAAALDVLRNGHLALPHLIVLYATMDILAYIWAGGDDTRSGPRFKDFTEKYVVKHLPELTSSDLWGARCAILHTASPESSASRRNVARQLVYSWGPRNFDIVKEIVATSPTPKKYVAISVEALEKALFLGMSELAKDLETDGVLRHQCEERAKQTYSLLEPGKIRASGQRRGQQSAEFNAQ